MTGENDELNFVSEDEGSAPAVPEREGWRILLVDDDPDVHLATEFALKNVRIMGRPLEFLHAQSACAARSLLLHEDRIAVAFIDVVMESNDAGLQLVTHIRDELGLSDMRIILRTGQPGYAPENVAIRDYDINDYKTKSELTSNRLYATLTAAIRSYSQICTINSNRRGLEMIMRAGNDLMALMSLQEFTDKVIGHAASLLDLPPAGIVYARHAGVPGNFLAMTAVGRFGEYHGTTLAALDDPELAAFLAGVAETKQSAYGPDRIALFIASTLGSDLILLIETAWPVDDAERQLLGVFCSNAAVCLDNATLVARLHEQTYYDPLSRLPNRVHFVEKIREAFASGQTSNLTLALVDIDHFSEANDALGHQYGDRLLRAIAGRLQAAVGPSAIIARVAGDAFGLLGHDEVINPSFLAEIFRTDFMVDGTDHTVSATFGLARLSEVDSVGYAMQDAGIALKRAKLQHRGHYCYYTRNMGGEVRTRVRLMQDLRRALGAGSLFLMFQPQISLADGRPVGAETLLRWRTSGGQLVPPDQFIPLAEDSGLIVSIGDWALRSALQEVARLVQEGYRGFRMAVNVSVVQFRHPDFTAMLEDALTETGANPTNVELEITESVAMLDPERIIALLKRVKELGFSVAIDDFGTGFSSLAYLQRLPVDRLKIDRSFVSRVVYASEAKNIAEMIIDLGRNLGMSVIAEGVEDEVQADYLKSRGCDEAQGYLYARPLDALQLRTWLHERTR